MEQNRKPRGKPMDTLSSTKEARIYHGEKTISLTSGAEKTSQPFVKEWNKLEHSLTLITAGSSMTHLTE